MTNPAATATPWNPLEGVRVLEIAGTTTGAYVGKLFREYGADVVLVEDPARRSEVREYGPFADGGSDGGGLHRYLHAGKRAIALRDTHPDGSALVSRLAASAHLVIHEYTLDEATARGLTYAQLAGRRADVVALAVTPFGQTGPRSSWKATEEITFALSGRMTGQGELGRRPLAYAPIVVAAQVAMTAAGAAIAAINAADVSGTGCDIDVSALEAQVSSVDSLLLMWTMGGWEPPRGLYPPYTYPCADGYILLGATGGRYIEGLAFALGRPEIAQDERFNTPTALADNMSEFNEIVIPYFLQFDMHHLIGNLQKFGVMCAPILSPTDALADPQYAFRHFFQPLDSSFQAPVPGPAFRLDPEVSPPVPSPAPALGEHTDDVLEEWLALSSADISALRQLGAVS